jgi:hypothetical protein
MHLQEPLKQANSAQHHMLRGSAVCNRLGHLDLRLEALRESWLGNQAPLHKIPTAQPATIEGTDLVRAKPMMPPVAVNAART